MQALTVDVNHLNPGVRYKFVKNNGNIYSGVYNRRYIVEGNNDNQEHMLVFENVVDETTNIEQGGMHILSDFIIEIYAVVSSRSGKLPADIAREISSYGGRINRRRSRNKTRKQKRKTRKQKRKTRKQRS